MSLEDESDLDIAKKVVRLFSEICKENLKYLTTLREYKNNLKFNIPFPCKVNDDVEIADSSSDNDDDDEEEKNSENNDNDNNEEGEVNNNLNNKKIKGSNIDNIPDLLDEDFYSGCNVNNDDDDGFVEVNNKKKKK